MRTSIKFLGALAVAGLIAAGGSAYTDSNTQPATQTVGYGSTTITGATVSSMAYTLSTDGTNVNSVALVLVGDTSTHTVSIGFNTDPITGCGTGAPTGQVTADPTADPPVAFAAGITTYTCNNAGGNFTRLTEGLLATHVVVNN